MSEPLLRPAHRWRELMCDPADDPVGHFSDEAQDMDYGCLVQHGVGRIIEDYADCKRALCVHARVRAIDDNAMKTSYWRVVFQRFPDVQFDALVAHDAAGVRELQIEPLGDNSSGVYHAVLVGVGEFTKDRKLVVRRLIPSFVRLILVQPLEVRVGQERANTGVLKSATSVCNRKLDASRLVVGGVPLKMDESKLPDSVVECRTEIVDAVSDTNAPLDYWKLSGYRRRVEVYLSGIRLVMAPDGVSVRVKEPQHVFIQGLDVLKSASGLGFGTGEGGSH